MATPLLSALQAVAPRGGLQLFGALRCPDPACPSPGARVAAIHGRCRSARQQILGQELRGMRRGGCGAGAAVWISDSAELPAAHAGSRGSGSVALQI